MKKIFLLLVFVALASYGICQEFYSHQTSSTPESSRFQIVQSEYGARYTFNIDKYTGNVFLFVKNKSENTWELIESEDQSNDETIPNQVNYQIFTSGLGPRFTFLINVNTGITWQLVEDNEMDIYWWKAIE
jgi:hypothetical protein